MRKINKIIIHHSASPLITTVDDIREWHVHNNGWSDIGYHYIILGDGSIEDGRPITKIGAHCKGKNRYSIGVCVVGNFENITPTPQQVASMVKKINDLCATYKLTWENVYGHCDFSTTLCPGKSLYHVLSQFKKRNTSSA
jgi:N-acetylmuramoyl-L-alanine amidase